jgi:hypothetical protein
MRAEMLVDLQVNCQLFFPTFTKSDVSRQIVATFYSIKLNVQYLYCCRLVSCVQIVGRSYFNTVDRFLTHRKMMRKRHRSLIIIQL